MNIEYYILNPTGNITALVTSKVDLEKYNIVSKKIMELYPDVEQVGFVDLSKVAPCLRMAGGEFCGNATMSAAVLFCEKNGCLSEQIPVNVYGTDNVFPVNVKNNGDYYSCELSLPKSNGIKEMVFQIDGRTYNFPIVNFAGISHIIATKDLPEETVKNILIKYCENLLLPAMGIMLYNKDNNSLVPYVYVRKCKTLFAENSCASGTCALCEYLTKDFDREEELEFVQPGGTLKASSSGKSAFIKLFGDVKITKHFIGEIIL